MNSTKYRLGAALLGVIITTTLVAGSTYAFGGWGQGGNNYREAIEAGDYTLLGENPKITEDQFNKKLEIHNLVQEEKYEEAKALAGEYGINKFGHGLKKGWHKKGRMKIDPEKRAAVKAALEAGDYTAWLNAVGEDSKIAEIITEENFPRLLEAHSHMGAARAIFEELGIKKGPGRHK